MDTPTNTPSPAPAPSGGSGKTVLWVIIAVIIIGGLVWYFMSHGKKAGDMAASQTKSADQTASPMQQATSGSGSFKDLIAMGKPQTCDISFKSASTTEQGTVFIGAGKMRGDFSAQVNGQAMGMHMIAKDQTSYTWMDGQAMGFKAMMQASSTQASNTPNSRAVDQNQNVKYNCKNWDEDDAQFDLPSGINFQDSMMMQGSAGAQPKGGAMMQGSASGSAAACAACNSLSGTQKSQCLSALACK